MPLEREDDIPMTKPKAGAPRKYASGSCPYCNEPIGMTYLARHIQKRHAKADGIQHPLPNAFRQRISHAPPNAD